MPFVISSGASICIWGSSAASTADLRSCRVLLKQSTPVMDTREVLLSFLGFRIVERYSGLLQHRSKFVCLLSGMDDQSHLRVDYSNFFPPTSASSSTLVNSHPFHQHPGGAGDPYPNQSLSQDSVDLLDVLKLDQYDLGMLNDVNLGHMVDPETEEQFRLDNNNQ